MNRKGGHWTNTLLELYIKKDVTLNTRHAPSEISPDGLGLGRPQCSSSFAVHPHHATGQWPMLIASTMAILLVSLIFTTFPLFCNRIRRRYRLNPNSSPTREFWELKAIGVMTKFTWGVRYFGTGVIMGSAFLHILPAAQIYLTDPCLSDFWVRKYPVMGNLIVLISIVAIFFFDFFIKRWIEKGSWVPLRLVMDIDKTFKPVLNQNNLYHAEAGETHIPLRTRAQSSITIDPERIWPRQLNHFDRARVGSSNSFASYTDIPFTEVLCPSTRQTASLNPAFGFSSSVALFSDGTPSIARQELMNILVLQMGIIIHSLFLGIALMLSDSERFISFLIAIIFHQVFEGLALGVRLAELTSVGRIPFAACIIYGIATPLGCCIGLGIRREGNLNPEVALIVMGIFDAFSAGLLVYAGMVGLLAKDFLGNMAKADIIIIRWSLTMFVMGIIVMAVLAIWA